MLALPLWVLLRIHIPAKQRKVLLISAPAASRRSTVIPNCFYPKPTSSSRTRVTSPRAIGHRPPAYSHWC